MLNEFYKYIANTTISFFQSHAETIRPGERYRLQLDTAEMVEGVDKALRIQTELGKIQGKYQYGDVYSTFTIRLSASMEIVIASKIGSMTDDFLTTLRNEKLTEKHFPILIIMDSTKDSINSGTGNLAANGMPFHVASIISKIKGEIASAQLSDADQAILELELERRQGDRFSDRSSLYEYSNLLTVLGRGFVEKGDFASFGLLYDDNLTAMPKNKLKERLEENHVIFDKIDRVVKHGNIEDSLDKEYDKPFIDHLVIAKKKGKPWYEGYTFDMVKSSRERLIKKKDNPLEIQDESISVYSRSAIEYTFAPDTLTFIRSDGETKAKKRRKNILIFNPDQQPIITVLVRNNLSVRSIKVECTGAECAISSQEIHIHIHGTGCTFARVIIRDLNNKFAYLLKICVLNILPKYLEEIQTNYWMFQPLSKRRLSKWSD